MRFKGSNKGLTNWFNTLISLYGADATMADIQRSIAAVRGDKL